MKNYARPLFLSLGLYIMGMPFLWALHVHPIQLVVYGVGCLLVSELVS